MNEIIGIQGITGSFHHQVAQEYFNQAVVVDECLSFEELVDNLLSGKSDQAVMAIENSIAGPIIPNYALIDKNNLHIIGEHYLRIHQNLMVLKGQKIEDIRVNGELVPIINKEAIMNVPTKTSNLINDSNFVTKPYVDTHIVNKANPHEVTKEQVGLGNVDNTSDLNKPISTATQLALDSKIPTTGVKSEIIYEDLKPVNSKAVEKYAVKKVNTIADLRLTKGDEEGQVITLLGYQKAGDKKPLNYIYSVNSLSLDDGGPFVVWL